MPVLSPSNYATKGTPAGSDYVPILDSADSNAVKLALLSTLPAGSFPDAFHYVSAGSNKTAEIQAAINAAAARSPAGGTVLIGPGITTTGILFMEPNVTLRGVGRHSTMLRPVSGTYSAGSYLINCDEPTTDRDITISDLYIDCQNVANLGGIKIDNVGITGDARNRIFNVNVRYARQGEAGIWFGQNSRDGLIYNCDIRDTAQGLTARGSDFTAAFVTIAGSLAGPNFYSIGSNQRFIGCKGFYAGYNYDNGQRFFYPNYQVGGSVRNITFDGCESQDAGGHGFQFGAAGDTCTVVTATGCISEASNAFGSGGDAYHFGGCSGGTIGACTSKNTSGLSGQQEWGIGFSGTNSNIDLTAPGIHEGTSGAIEAAEMSLGLQILLKGAKSYTIPQLVAGEQTSTTVTVTGAKVSSSSRRVTNAAFSGALGGRQIWSEVTADDTLTVHFRNGTSSTIAASSAGTLWGEVFRQI